MSYCKTGPAIGPSGPGHMHQVQCSTGPAPQPGVPFHTHALEGLGACCSGCASGGSCGSQSLGSEAGGALKFAVFLASAGIGLWLISRR